MNHRLQFLCVPFQLKVFRKNALNPPKSSDDDLVSSFRKVVNTSRASI